MGQRSICRWDERGDDALRAKEEAKLEQRKSTEQMTRMEERGRCKWSEGGNTGGAEGRTILEQMTP